VIFRAAKGVALGTTLLSRVSNKTRTVWLFLLLLAYFGCSNGVDESQTTQTPSHSDNGPGAGNGPGSGNGGSSVPGAGYDYGDGPVAVTPTSGSDPTDQDGDGLPLEWETQYGLSDTDPNDAYQDSDGDYLINRREFQLGLDPSNADSDGDRVPDGVEVDIASDPLVAGKQIVVTVCKSNCDYTLVSDALAAGEAYISVRPGSYVDNIHLGSSRHVFSEAGAANTTISAAIEDHVVNMNSASSLHGFTIRGGKAGLGGGIYASPLGVMIRANIIRDNVAIDINNDGSLGYGGGIYIASQGSAQYSVRVEQNEILNNSAYWGGGIVVSDYAYAEIHANRIHNNVAQAGVDAPSTLQAALGGGAFLSQYAEAYCINNVIYNNEARKGIGGGIYAGTSNAIIHNTVVANLANSGSGISATSVVTGNIIWNNIPVDQSLAAVKEAHFNISNIIKDASNGRLLGVGNQDVDPQFVNADIFDYRLQSISPAIDNGYDGHCNGLDVQINCVVATKWDQVNSTGVAFGIDYFGVARDTNGDGAAVAAYGDDDAGALEYLPPPL